MPQPRMTIASSGGAVNPNTVVLEAKATEVLGAGDSFSAPTARETGYQATSDGGEVTLSSTPFGAAPPPDGSEINVTGLSDVDYFILPFADVVNGCLLDGDFVGKRGCNLKLKWNNTLQRYLEIGRSQLQV